MKTILLTGFEPFADWKVNPTEIAARQLNGSLFGDVRVEGHTVPLRFEDIGRFTSELVTVYRPSAIIMSGQAGGDKIRLERVAQNKAESKVPYNCGTITTGEVLYDDGEDSYTSTLPLERYFSRLQKENIPVRYSDSAGLFGCNQIFYEIRYLFPEIPAGFIHVPLLPEQKGKESMTQDIITRAISVICEETAKWLD